MDNVESEARPRIYLETRKREAECLVCSEHAAEDCETLARAFADHFADAGAIPDRDALLGRVNRVDEWIVCDRCQLALSGEDKIRLMSLWVVMEGMRNWIRTEMRLGLGFMLPASQPIQLA